MTGKGRRRLCAAVAAGILMAAGCGNKNEVVSYDTGSENMTTITFFGNKYEPENVVVIEKILSGFMEENPEIRVSYESLKGSDYYEALTKRMEAGKGDDVFMVNHDVLLELKAQGQVADLSGLDTISAYTDSMRSQMEEAGKIYWVPTTVSAFGLYCNQDLLKEHGQPVPENLGEWENVCDYFVSKGITPIVANNDISLKTMVIGMGFLQVYQENRQTEVFQRLNSGQEQLSEYLALGLAKVEEFIQKGYVDGEKALATKKTSDDLEEFAKGQAPFMLTGAWAAPRVKTMNPKLAFEVAPLPLLEEGTLVVINPDTRLSVNANSENLDAAMKFLEYFTRKENIETFADQQASFSPLKGGGPSSVREIQRLVPGYQSGRTVLGTDALLDIPIWELTAEGVKKLLAGEDLQDTIHWMDEQAAQERSAP